MNSMMHTSSQFDKYASTIDGTLIFCHPFSGDRDGTQVSLQHYQVSMRSEVDPAEQAHNNMNLALGKPT